MSAFMLQGNASILEEYDPTLNSSNPKMWNKVLLAPENSKTPRVKDASEFSDSRISRGFDYRKARAGFDSVFHRKTRSKPALTPSSTSCCSGLRF